MPAQYTMPPDTRATGSGDPPNDVNALIRALNAMGAVYNVMNTAFAGGAKGDNVTNDTAAIQAAINAAAAAGTGTAPSGGIVYIPAGQYRVSQLTMASGTILQGVSSGTFPGGNAIPGCSVLTRIASTNLDLIVAPDGINYGRLLDLAIDGNKLNNTAGRGFVIADAAVAQEAQFIVQRCYIHDNPDSNVYMGHFRRATKILDTVCNYSANGDGITDAGSDNTIRGCICGSNGRAGVCLGTTATQNWAATTSFAAAVAHVSDCDCYQNITGIAIAAFSSDNVVENNGLDRNSKNGATVFDGASNTIVHNSFHSNSTVTNNTWAHIDVAAGVLGVNISDNNFGPQDLGFANVCTYAVNVAAGAAAGCVNGNIGVVDSTATVSGLINLPPKRLMPPPAQAASLKPANPAATASGSLVTMGLGSACVFTPKGTGRVKLTFSGSWLTATATVQGAIGARYGTGTAPVNGAADTGTAWGTNAVSQNIRAAGTGGGLPFTFVEVVSLTVGTAYWLDLVTSTNTPADVATITNVTLTAEEMLT